ncbi:MAG TPA: oxygen-independent coproporphyrinogen III oxidase [Candidatus Angelobacter sp.]|nr:oxygen-independent coproporphyrinogen III oxidase [Candidatus Angelobacter sp.]
MSALKVDLDLVRKYNVPGPRYTSYPPATRFTDEVSVGQLLEKICANNETERDLSLYFHLPFCQSLCWFCGCTTVITTDQRASATYLNYLKRELGIMGRLLNPKRKVVQLHLGGGTPTFLAPEEIRALGRMIHSQFDVSPDAEAGVEIDPRRVTRGHLDALRDAGFNRASLGVQDHNPLVQKAVHRIQPFAQTKMVVDWIRDTGFRSLNVDLIYGLPHQTPESFEKTLNETLQLRPDRLAVFSYAHVPWIKPAQKILADKILPPAETKLQLLKLTIERLTSEGYVYIGMDHFARADDELAVAQRQKTLQRNFQGYSTRGGADVYAFGMSSISQADGVYWQNLKELPAYYAALDARKAPLAKGCILTDEDKVRRQTIMRLMCDLSLNYAEMSEMLGKDFTTYFAGELDSLADLESDHLIRKDAAGITVTDSGRLFIRNIAMRFDACAPTQNGNCFSKTI